MDISSTLTSNDDTPRQLLRFTVPNELVEIDLTGAPEARVKRAYANASAVMRGATETQRVHMVFMQEMMISQLSSQGAVYAGQLIATSDADPAKLATAQFSVLVKPAELDAHNPLEAVAGGLREPGKARELGFTTYPAGNALVVTEEVTVTMPTTVTGEPVVSSYLVAQAQIIFACPDRKHIAMFTVSSDSLADWRSYIAILDGMAKSVSFRQPGTSTITNRLSGF